MTSWGTTKFNENVLIYTLENPDVKINILNYGCIIQKLETKDADGEFDDIVTGFDSIEEYHEKSRFFGCIVGRVANRTASGKFSLNGEEYNLVANNGPNHLHGGTRGWDKYCWKTEEVSKNMVKFSHVSADGDEGYPCEVKATCTYKLDGKTLSISYTAENLDKTRSTPMNMTNHSYFNLSGHKKWGNLDEHNVKVFAEHFTPVSDTLIPTGEIKKVENTGFDLRTGLNMTAEQLKKPDGANGYDHNYAFGEIGMHDVLYCEHPNGRSMKVESDAEGVQFYTGNFVPDCTGKGASYGKQTCFCVETQCYPNAVNEASFPTNVVKAGEVYRHNTNFMF